MKHTLGPWEIGRSHSLEGSNRNPVRFYGDGIVIAMGGPTDEDRANYTLMKASPEMYEALKALHSTALKFGGIHTSEYLSGYRHKPWEEMMDALTIALTALEKAEGRKP